MLHRKTLLLILPFFICHTISAQTIITYAGNGVIGLTIGGPATNAVFSNPSAIATDLAGNVYVTENGNFIRKISVSGIITNFAGIGAVHSGDGGPATAA